MKKVLIYPKMNKKIFLTFFFAGLLILTRVFPARASIASCSVSVNPASLATNMAGSLNFLVTNNDSALEAKWVKISAPGEYYEIISGSGSGWSGGASSSTEAVFQGSLTAGSSAGFNLRVQTGINSAPSQSWTVQVSDQTDGSGAVTCGGDASVGIGGPGMDSTPPVISSVSVSDISSSGATVRWATNELATSIVVYGTTVDYGSKKETVDLVASHEIVLTGLEAEKTYHYQARSADSAGNIVQTSDNTFTTAKVSAVSTPVPDTEPTIETTTAEVSVTTPTPSVRLSTKPTPVSTPIPTPITPRDTVSPRVVINTDLSKPFEVAPRISGRAVDESGIGAIDYSIDGGGNWLPVESRSGTNVVDFGFAPGAVADSSYKIVVRARDRWGNTGVVSTKLVIDRLPPNVGPAYVSYGPQTLLPGTNGWYQTVQGIDLKVVVSASGGPDTIDLIAGEKENEQVFSLVKNFETGLWSGMLSFAKTGNGIVRVRAKDGAGRLVERDLLYFQVLDKTRILDKNNQSLIGASVAVYVRDADGNKFIVWDGAPFGVKNPTVVDEKGGVSLILPAGEYYLQVEKGSFYRGRTPIFKLEQAGVLPAVVKVLNSSVFSGILSRFLPSRLSINFDFSEKMAADQLSLIGKEMPFVGFSGSKGTVFSSDLKGKPLVLTFLGAWLPDTAEQLANLSKISQDTVSVVGVFVQSSVMESMLYRSRGNYQVNTYADPTGEAVVPFGLRALPVTFFVDQSGVVRAVRNGIVTKKEIERILVSLGM